MLAQPKTGLEKPTQEFVWISASRVRDALQVAVTRACATARVKAQLWDGRPPVPGGPNPTLLITALERGERRIPDDAVSLMTREFPGLPLLLLCDDDLVRPTVSLQNGRVTLLGPPLTVERIASRIRIILADRRGESLGTLEYGVGEHARAFVQEHSTPLAYVAVMSANSGSPEGPSAEMLAPLIENEPTRGVTVSLATNERSDGATVQAAFDAMVKDDTDDEKQAALLRLVGASTGLAHLSASREWSFYWPSTEAGLFISSPMRLPPVWNMADAMTRAEVPFLRHAAASGDVLLALFGAKWPARPGMTERDERNDLAEAASAGGPKVLDLLLERVRLIAAPVCGLVMEVR